MNRWKDKLGIAASVTCAVHCAATPFLLIFLPALKFTEWLASPQFHQVAAIICVGLVAISIWPTFRKYKDYRVLGLSSAGLSMIMAAAFFLPDHCCSHAEITTLADPNVAAVCTDGCCADSVFAKRRAMFAGNGNEPALGNAGSPSPDSPSHDSHQHTDFASTLFGSTLVAMVQPWLTPIGGVLLVLAHAFNLGRRRTDCGSVGCGCTSSATFADSSAATGLSILQNAKAA